MPVVPELVWGGGVLGASWVARLANTLETFGGAKSSSLKKETSQALASACEAYIHTSVSIATQTCIHTLHVCT